MQLLSGSGFVSEQLHSGTAFVSEQLLSGTVSSVSNSSVVNTSASSVCNSSAVTVSSVTWDAWASSGSLGLRKVCEGAKVRRGEDAKVRACTVGRSVGRSVDWSDGRAVKVRGDRRAKTSREQR